MQKNMCVKVEAELYEKIKQAAELEGISLSVFMRNALMKSTCDSHENDDNGHSVSHEERTTRGRVSCTDGYCLFVIVATKSPGPFAEVSAGRRR